MGRVTEYPFDAVEVGKLLERIVAELESQGLALCKQGDRDDVPIDVRFLGLLLRAAKRSGWSSSRKVYEWSQERECHAYQHFTSEEKVEAGISNKPQSSPRG